jgi:hypothetical protein
MCNFKALFLVALCVAAGCAPSYPLSINMYNPNTGDRQKCAARERSASDIPVLARAVEACARNLESKGYIRVSDPRAHQGASVESASVP